MRISFKSGNIKTIANVATVSDTAETNVLKVVLMDGREYLLTGNRNIIMNKFAAVGFYDAPEGSMKLIH